MCLLGLVFMADPDRTATPERGLVVWGGEPRSCHVLQKGHTQCTRRRPVLHTPDTSVCSDARSCGICDHASVQESGEPR